MVILKNKCKSVIFNYFLCLQKNIKSLYQHFELILKNVVYNSIQKNCFKFLFMSKKGFGVLYTLLFGILPIPQKCAICMFFL